MSKPTDVLHRVTSDEVERAAGVLTRSFIDDPMIVYLFDDPGTREESTFYFFKYVMRYALINGEPYASSPNFEGVALWFPSETLEFSREKMIEAGIGELFKRVKPEIPERMRLFFTATGDAHGELMPAPHWYLMIIGVDPEHQGKKVASRLLRAKLDRIDTENRPCYLETMSESNIPLYEHFGFKVVATLNPVNSGVITYVMVREGRVRG